LPGYGASPPYSPPAPFGDPASPAEEAYEDEDAPIADSPSWPAIGALVGIVLFGAGMGAGLGFLLGAGSDPLWLGAVLGAFAAGTFGVAAIGWTYKNMDWIPMTYGERTVVLVMGILFLCAPLVLWILHPLR